MGERSSEESKEKKGEKDTYSNSLSPGANQQVEGDPELAELLPVEQRGQNVPAPGVVDQQLPIAAVLLELVLPSLVRSLNAAEIEIDHSHEGIC